LPVRGLPIRSIRARERSGEIKNRDPPDAGYRRKKSVSDTFHAFEPILLFALVLIGFCIVNLILAHTIGPKRRTPVKDMPYESGMDPIADARQPFDVKFSLIAILFLLFDVELLFLFPWAVSAYVTDGVPVEMRQNVFWTMIAFVLTLLVPYVYAWRKGVFQWR
jgi:NADH-quinone oxidoreductase subunit A